jgi:ABC-type uncharacterized transport system permease subunit
MTRAERGSERSFGLSVGGVLLAIAAIALWRQRALTAEIAGGIGVVLVVLGAVAPRLLAPVNVVWWRFAHALGYVNARIILTVAFAIVLTPIGLVWRLTGRDPLARRVDRWSGWTAYPVRYADRDHYKRMY